MPSPLTGNLLQQLPKDLSQEVFEKLVELPGLTIERIVSKGQSSPESGWYDQANGEWVLVLQGEGQLEFEQPIDGQHIITLTSGDYIDIPAHTRHRVLATSSEPETIWLAIHYTQPA